ncbi:MAG: hypothetical protein WD696_09015 [Bryobacteraceae bacterium]
MESIVEALGGLLLRALPTFILVVLLHFYLKFMFFRPLEHVLQARREATEGARKLAEQSLAKASEKAAQYEAALRAAKSEIYLEQEQLRRQLQEERAASVRMARERSDAAIRAAREQLAADASVARQSLAAESDSLAERIAQAILPGRAA